MTRGDILLLAAVVALSLLVLPLSGAMASGSASKAVVHSPAGETSVPLDRPGRYEIEGAQGIVVLEVSGGRVSAVSADCPDQLCVKSSFASPGRPVVCAPNGVSVTLSGSGGKGLDAVSR